MRGTRDGHMPWMSMRLMALALLGAGLPAAGGAQQTAPVAGAASDSGVVHTVRKGDTLWDLARTYLSDPFAWPVIHRPGEGIGQIGACEVPQGVALAHRVHHATVRGSRGRGCQGLLRAASRRKAGAEERECHESQSRPGHVPVSRPTHEE